MLIRLGLKVELKFGSVGIFWREENQLTWGKTPEARTKTNNKPNPHMASTPSIEPGPHCWKPSAVINAPFLSPKTFGFLFRNKYPMWTSMIKKLTHFSVSDRPHMYFNFSRDIRVVFNCLIKSKPKLLLWPITIKVYSPMNQSHWKQMHTNCFTREKTRVSASS